LLFALILQHDEQLLSRFTNQQSLTLRPQLLLLKVVSVKGSSGWAFEMALRPSSELALFEKYSVSDYVQDNWFVLAAILKDE